MFERARRSTSWADRCIIGKTTKRGNALVLLFRIAMILVTVATAWLAIRPVAAFAKAPKRPATLFLTPDLSSATLIDEANHYPSFVPNNHLVIFHGAFSSQ